MFSVAHFVETLMSDLLDPFDIVIQLCVDVKPTVRQGINLMDVMARCRTSFMFLALFVFSFSLSCLTSVI